MTENKRFTSWGNRIKRNGTLLNIEFKTKLDAKLCCKLLNQMDKDQKEYIDELDEIFKWHKKHYGKSILDERLEFKSDCEKENEKLKETNQELYDFRLVLNALLFNEWAETGKYEVYKSKRHHDGEPCFDGEWFIVVAILPSGQVTNHYHIKYWDYFKIPSYEIVKDEFDGHTSSVVLLRYGVLLE